MAHVITLIAAPGTDVLQNVSTQLQSRLSELSPSTHWLSLNEAVDITVARRSDDLPATVAEEIGEIPIDFAILPAEKRAKKLMIADMDSTMIQQECIDELAAELGLKEKVSAITAAAMRGEIEFEPALRERVSLLVDLDETVVQQVIERRISLMPGGKTLVATARAHGMYTALVSGGFTAFTNPIASIIGFHENRANTLLSEHGKLTGRVAEPILGQQAKVDALLELCQRLGIDPADALAVGDGANDLGMIKLAGLGVALHAKPAVAAEADVRIDHGDLTALLYLMGIKRSDWTILPDTKEAG